MTIEDLKKGEYETVEYKQDIPLVKEKYLKTAVPTPMWQKSC